MARTVQKARHWWATEAAKRKQRQQQLHSSGAISPRPGSIAAWQLAHNQPLTPPRPSVQTDSDSDSDSDDDLGHEAKEILSNMSPEFTELLGDGSDSDDEDSPHDAAAPPPAGRAVGESVSSEVSTVPEPEVPAAEVLAAQVTLELPVATCSDKTARPKSARARQRLAKRKALAKREAAGISEHSDLRNILHKVARQLQAWEAANERHTSKYSQAFIYYHKIAARLKACPRNN